MALVAIGQFGYAWLGFARRNYWIGPGSLAHFGGPLAGLCVELGLLVFAVSAARGHTLPRRVWGAPFLMAVFPVLVIAASQVVALVRGARLLSVDDIYLQGLYVAEAVLWIVLGSCCGSSGALRHDLVAKVPGYDVARSLVANWVSV